MDTAQSQRHVVPVVGGERAEGSETAQVGDYTTGDAFASVLTGDDATLAGAVSAAAAAVPATRDATVRERAAWCEAVGTELRERSATVADALVREAGVPVTSAREEVAGAAGQFDAVADLLTGLTGKYRTWTTAERALDNSLVTAAPLGVVRCRPASRAPLATAALQVAPALAGGNSVVLTPPATTPVAVSMLSDIVGGVVPDGAVGFVPGAADGADTQESADAVLDAESGTAGVGRFEHRQGGRATTLVFQDADLDAAAAAIAAGGPSAVRRRLAGGATVLVHEAVRDGLVSRLDEHLEGWQAGDLFEADTTVAPMRDALAAERLGAIVDNAVTGGATLVRGGAVDGREVDPTLLADVPPGAAVRRESRLGPVVPVTTFEDDAGGRRLAADLGPARTVRVCTDRHSLAMRVADSVDADTVSILGSETGSRTDGTPPLGGRLSEADIEALTRTKWVVHR